MMKKTIELDHDIGDEVTIKVLCLRGIVSAIGIYPNDRIQYQVEYGGGGIARQAWVEAFEVEKPKDSTIGFTKNEKKEPDDAF